MVAHLREWSNVMLTLARTRNLIHGAEAQFIFCSDTQSWCVIKQKAQHSVRSFPEMRDHTQENQKTFAKKSAPEKFFSPRTEWWSKCFWQRYN